ncbi:MAG: hypothetical protein AAFO91_07545 [Bacteroidota bacterium]
MSEEKHPVYLGFASKVNIDKEKIEEVRCDLSHMSENLQKIIIMRALLDFFKDYTFLVDCVKEQIAIAKQIKIYQTQENKFCKLYKYLDESVPLSEDESEDEEEETKEDVTRTLS